MRVIKQEMARLIPDMTFLEAYEKTGRSINYHLSRSAPAELAPAEPYRLAHRHHPLRGPGQLRSAGNISAGAAGGAQCARQGPALPAIAPLDRWLFSQDLPAKRLARLYSVNHFIVSQVMPGLGRDEPRLRPGMNKIISDAAVAATKEIVRGCLDFAQRRLRVGPRLGVAMNTVNALIDQQFYRRYRNIFPGYGVSSLSAILKMLSEEEMVELIRAGERATWPKVPAIRVTTGSAARWTESFATLKRKRCTG